MSEQPHHQEDPRASMTLVVAVIGALLVFVVIVGLQAYFYDTERTEQVNKIDSEAPDELARLRAQQQEQLAGYHWIDEKKGVVSIPIDQAMDLMVRDSSASRPHAPNPFPAGKE